MSLLSIVVVAVAVLVYLAWYGLPFVAAAPGLGYWRAQRVNQARFAIGNGVPGGGAFGLGVQYAMFASYGYPAAAAAAAIAAIGVAITPAVLRFRSSIDGLVRRRWAAITGAQLGVTVTQFAILYVALRGLEGWGREGTPLLAAFAAFAIGQLGMLVPVTPGGLGTVDAAMVALLVALGTRSGEATAAALVCRAASFVPQIIVGVLALVLWSRAAHRLASRGLPKRTT